MERVEEGETLGWNAGGDVREEVEQRKEVILCVGVGEEMKEKVD